MGFGDLLKKAKEKATEIQNVASNLSNELNDKLDKAREEMKERAKEQAQQAAEEEKNKMQSFIDTPTCEHGNCAKCAGRFYYDCDINVKCDKKLQNMRQIDQPLFDDMMPILKLYSLGEAELNSNYKFEAIHRFLEKYMPNFLPAERAMRGSIVYNGISRKNYFLMFCMSLGDIELGEDADKKVEFLAEFLKTKIDANGIRESCKLQTPQSKDEAMGDWYKNQSLYDRNFKDFEYTVKVFENSTDGTNLLDFGSFSMFSINDLYDDVGNIKSAGIGGPQVGETGDTIWNAIEGWYNK